MKKKLAISVIILPIICVSHSYAQGNYRNDNKELENLSDLENRFHQDVDKLILDARKRQAGCKNRGCRAIIEAEIQGYQKAQKEREDKNDTLKQSEQ